MACGEGCNAGRIQYTNKTCPHLPQTEMHGLGQCGAAPPPPPPPPPRLDNPTSTPSPTPFPAPTMTISPCSVMRNEPSTEPGGWLWMARCVGPPPRPTLPPRPWKSVSLAPCCLVRATSDSWHLCVWAGHAGRRVGWVKECKAQMS